MVIFEVPQYATDWVALPSFFPSLLSTSSSFFPLWYSDSGVCVSVYVCVLYAYIFVWMHMSVNT